MPYRLAKQGDEYCVVHDDGSAVPGGCHRSRQDALDHLRALYANVPDATKADKPEKPAVHTDEGPKLDLSDVRHIAGAIEALSPSGFRGRRVQLTSAERHTAIAAIRRRIHAVSMSDEERQRLLTALGKVSKAFVSFYVEKQADGTYRWWGYPTNNAKDRDGEILSGKALGRVISRQKAEGDYPDLWFYHIPYPAGQTDYMFYEKGFVGATGTFHKDLVSERMAQYCMEHPESIDNSGWGMSHTFRGWADKSGVYHEIEEIREFTFLPLSRAANPYSEFSVEEKMKIRKDQQAALDAVLQDETLKEIVSQHLAASQKSENLDQMGVQRKSAGEVFGFGSDAAFSAPPPMDEKALPDGASPDVVPDSGDDNLKPTGRQPGVVAAGLTEFAACHECSHAADEHMVGKSMTFGACKVKGCTCKGYTLKAAEPDADDEGGKPDDDADDEKKPPKKKPAEDAAPKTKKSAAELSPAELAEEIGQFVQKEVQAVRDEYQKLVAEQALAIEDLQARLEEIESSEFVTKARTTLPRRQLGEALAQFSATHSKPLDKRTKEYKQLGEGAPDIVELEKQAAKSEGESVARMFGFGGPNGN